MAFSPDSTKLALAQSDDIVFIYRLGTEWGEKKSICNKFQQATSVTSMVWPHGRDNELVFALADGKVGFLATSHCTARQCHLPPLPMNICNLEADSHDVYTSNTSCCTPFLYLMQQCACPTEQGVRACPGRDHFYQSFLAFSSLHTGEMWRVEDKQTTDAVRSPQRQLHHMHGS